MLVVVWHLSLNLPAQLVLARDATVRPSVGAVEAAVVIVLVAVVAAVALLQHGGVGALDAEHQVAEGAVDVLAAALQE